jgi:hypothetical protein
MTSCIGLSVRMEANCSTEIKTGKRQRASVLSLCSFSYLAVTHSHWDRDATLSEYLQNRGVTAADKEKRRWEGKWGVNSLNTGHNAEQYSGTQRQCTPTRWDTVPLELTVAQLVEKNGVSLQCLQECAIGPYHEPDESNLYSHTMYLQMLFNIMLPSTSRSPCLRLSAYPCTLSGPRWVSTWYLLYYVQEGHHKVPCGLSKLLPANTGIVK